MIGNPTAEMRLCPHCANSIAEDATDCRYCKTDFSSQFAPRGSSVTTHRRNDELARIITGDPQSLQNLSGWPPCSLWL